LLQRRGEKHSRGDGGSDTWARSIDGALFVLTFATAQKNVSFCFSHYFSLQLKNLEKISAGKTWQKAEVHSSTAAQPAGHYARARL
jgi:hypothetical protein